MNFQLKNGMLLGAASAATQIEGGDQNNNWYAWYRQGYIKDGADPSVATDHYNRWREDLALMRDMGVQCCRMGVEWSRIEPRDGVFDEAAIAHYREEIQALSDAGIPVLLTLHHFNNPLWLEERGGFAERDNITCYLRFVRKMVESVGDLVSEYITINEPNVYAFNAYLAGAWPPGRKSFLEMGRVMTNMAAAHIEAYGLIRKTRLQMGFRNTRVGVANHLRAFAPKDAGNPLHRFWAERAEELFQGSLTQAMCMGKVSFPIGKHPSIVPGRYCDFHGVNYYTRSTVSGPADGVAKNCPVNDLGWEIYPQGIVEVCEKVYGMLKRPIYITENGTCDNEDRFRARYIAEHLKALSESSLPVERYYHWCFCDNWEWVEGGSARFGLVHVDYENQKRTVKRSGEFYRRMIQAGGVDEALYGEFCDTPYPTNGEDA
ncbi:MAG: glycoside hydrolase family 1 protein [Oscillibacter sp.]|nr:glycoside hydrolase family 1 protein [Oscillibacter sp.]